MDQNYHKKSASYEDLERMFKSIFLDFDLIFKKHALEPKTVAVIKKALAKEKRLRSNRISNKNYQEEKKGDERFLDRKRINAKNYYHHIIKRDPKKYEELIKANRKRNKNRHKKSPDELSRTNSENVSKRWSIQSIFKHT